MAEYQESTARFCRLQSYRYKQGPPPRRRRLTLMNTNLNRNGQVLITQYFDIIMLKFVHRNTMRAAPCAGSLLLAHVVTAFRFPQHIRRVDSLPDLRSCSRFNEVGCSDLPRRKDTRCMLHFNECQPTEDAFYEAAQTSAPKNPDSKVTIALGVLQCFCVMTAVLHSRP